MEKKRKIVVVAGICKNQGKILVAKRTNGFWEFPGGKVECSETMPQALQREWKEELNATIEVASLVDAYPFEYEHIQVDLHFFWCFLLPSKIRCNVHEEIRWVDLDELKEISLLEGNQRVLEKIIW